MISKNLIRSLGIIAALIIGVLIIASIVNDYAQTSEYERQWMGFSLLLQAVFYSPLILLFAVIAYARTRHLQKLEKNGVVQSDTPLSGFQIIMRLLVVVTVVGGLLLYLTWISL